MAGNVPIYIDQGGQNMWVGPGGTLTILAGGTFNDAGGAYVPPANLALTNATVSGTLVAGNASAVTFNNTVSAIGAVNFTNAGTVGLAGATTVTGSLNLAAATVYNSTQVFVSAPRTATGGLETFAHGLRGTPLVFFTALNTTNAGIIEGGYTITPGATNATDILVTATIDLVYQAVAMLVTAAP